jgi:hypothetical protein
MAAADNLNPELFHGTLHPFEPGDIINPTDTEHSEQPMAYATPDLEHATKVARAKARMNERRNPDAPMDARVYAVEHISGPADLWMSSKYVADPEGFRVVRKVEQ